MLFHKTIIHQRHGHPPVGRSPGLIKKILRAALLSALLFHPAPCRSEGNENFFTHTTLREKAGRIMFIGINSRRLAEGDKKHLRDINPGGIVLYARNFKDASEIPPLVEEIKSALPDKGHRPFFAIDQEGGIVHRVEGESFRPPSAPSIGAAGSEGLAEEVGLSVGLALRELGIDINFSPVLDMPFDMKSSPMKKRSIGNDPERVERLGRAYIKGLGKAGVLSTAKHFPGAGKTAEDSHNRLPRIGWEGPEEKERDLLPFRGAIEEGVDIVMAGHFVAEPGDHEHPVSLSPYWLTEVLRDGLSFDGLILIDNIEMKAIQDLMPLGKAAVKSFLSGADVIMVSHERKKQKEVFDSLFKALQKGDISDERLDDSLRRLDEAEKKLSLHVKESASAPRLDEVARRVLEDSVVSILKEGSVINGTPFGKALYAGYNKKLFDSLKENSERAGIINLPVKNYLSKNKIPSLSVLLKGLRAVVVDAGHPDAALLISSCREAATACIVHIEHPWDTARILEALRPERAVVTFENSKAHIRAATEIALGLRRAKGTLPYPKALPEGYRYE